MNVALRRAASRALLSLLFLAATAAALPARVAAQPAGQSPEEAEKIRQAQELYDKATELYNEKQYELAVRYYERALELVSVPDIHYNIAKAFEKLAAYPKAIEHYQKYLDTFREQQGTEAPDYEDVRRTIDDLRRKSAPKQVKLSVATEPPGANVYLGTRESLVGQTPFETELDPGTYNLIVTLEGYEDVQQTVALKRGEPQRLTFSLQRKANMGALLVDTNIRGARIYVQGQVKGLTPYEEEILVPAGRRQVTLEKERYSPVTRIVDISAGKTLFLQEELFLDDVPYSWRGYLGWTFVGLGLAGIGGGIAVGVIGSDQDLFTDSQEFKDWQLYQGLAYGIGGGLTALGVGLVIWEHARTAVVEEDVIPARERIRPPAATPPGGSPPPVSLGFTPDGGVHITSQFRF
jgi:F0F1-type ATP synthase membrane subunit c/vacuolar-type H+-ATPase subunit K